MKSWVVVMGLLGSAGVVGAANAAGEPAGPKPIMFDADAKVSIDENGRPTSVEASKDLPEQIREFIEKQVGSWSFAPPGRNGKVSAGVTYVHLGACAIPFGESYHLAIDYKGNGPGYAKGHATLLPPPYPPNAARLGQQAAIKVTYIVEPDSTITVENTEFMGHAPGLAKRDFDKNVREWARQLNYLPEELDGKPVRTRLSVPVIFTLGSDGQIPGLKLEREKVGYESNECKLANDDRPGLMPIAEDSPFKLLNHGG